MKKLLLLLSLLPFSGCAANQAALKAQERPDWVSGQSAKYPTSAYLTGVGEGRALQDAEADARGQIASYFSSVVTVQSESSQRETDTSSGGKSASSFSQNLANDVRVTSKKALDGVSIADTWQDPRRGAFYALAVLDRAQAGNIVKDKISRFDADGERWMGLMERSTDSWSRAKNAMKALSLYEARESLNSDLRLLSPQGEGLPAPSGLLGLKVAAHQALSKIRVRVGVSGPGSDVLKSGLVKGISALGFSEAAAGSPAELQIDAVSSVEPVDAQDGRWKWVRSSAIVTVKDASSGEAFLSLKVHDKQASMSADMARARTLSALSTYLAARTNQALEQYMANQ